MYPSIDDLNASIEEARNHVYDVASPTPLQKLDLDSSEQIYIKREDLSPIRAYKWRGAFNRMRKLSSDERSQGVTCASAGNHAQGVALAARKLGVQARIFMPRSTPWMKQEAVRSIGGDAAEIVIEGDSYDAAFAEARQSADRDGSVFIHAYDDLAVMAGQGTLACEIVDSGDGPFDTAYLQIGGGGLAAGVASWLKLHYPDIEIVGVEGVGQASMSSAIEAGQPITLDYVDVFCDGTAVKRAGDLTHALCSQLMDRMETVTNEEVCAAMQLLWERERLIPEPAGAMGLAAWMKERDGHAADRKCLAIVCGANMDFGQLPWIVRHAGIGSAHRKYYRFFMEERSGALLHLLDTLLENVSIVEFQHGIVPGNEAKPVIGMDAMPHHIQLLESEFEKHGIRFEDATGDEDVEFRIIHYETSILQRPLFIRIEFPERPGALREFLKENCSEASIVYFNYNYTGERVGRALLGFDFASDAIRERFRVQVLEKETTLRHASELSADVLRRIT